MRTGRSRLLVALLAGACAGSPPAVPQAPRSEEPDAVPLTIEFEPALPAPARLQVAHESGERRDLATQCTGVAVSLPPGPVLLRLVAGERTLERSLQVQPGMPVLSWDVVGLLRGR
ncbi:MAG: hypothetical protein ACK501_00840 [Planctomycetota bacterium]|jgi:hypothetical protein